MRPGSNPGAPMLHLTSRMRAHGARPSRAARLSRSSRQAGQPSGAPACRARRRRRRRPRGRARRSGRAARSTARMSALGPLGWSSLGQQLRGLAGDSSSLGRSSSSAGRIRGETRLGAAWALSFLRASCRALVERAACRRAAGRRAMSIGTLLRVIWRMSNGALMRVRAEAIASPMAAMSSAVSRSLDGDARWSASFAHPSASQRDLSLLPRRRRIFAPASSRANL